jgi:hypothetical protein
VRIGTWHASYSLGLAVAKYEQGPYHDHSELIISGTCEHPKRFLGCSADITLLGNREMEEALKRPEQFGRKPLCIATVTAQKGTLNISGSIPVDALSALYVLLAAETIRWVQLDGEALRRGRSAIRWMRFERDIDPEEY